MQGQTLIGDSGGVGVSLSQVKEVLKATDALVAALTKKTPTPWDDLAWKFGSETLTGDKAAELIHAKLVAIGLAH